MVSRYLPPIMDNDTMKPFLRKVLSCLFYWDCSVSKVTIFLTPHPPSIQTQPQTLSPQESPKQPIPVSACVPLSVV